MGINIKRVYDPPADSDGIRILVDRLWPRGLAKDKARVDIWFKEIAPSTELRQWFGHDPTKWPEFRALYCSELDENQAAVAKLKELISQQATLLYGAKDTAHSHAVVLKSYLEKSA